MKRLAVLFALLAAGAFAQVTTIPAPVGGPSTINVFPYAVWGFGDSYGAGTGVAVPAAQSAYALIAKGVSTAPMFNQSAGGATAAGIGYQALAFFTGHPGVTSVSLMNGGANDAGCGTSAACVANYTAAMTAAEAWVTIPYSARIMGSVATGASWTADTTMPIATVGYTTGTPVQTTTSGAAKTFSIPSSASPVVGLTWEVTPALGGTFTVTLDGIAQIDPCTGSTTFVSNTCGGLTFADSIATAAFRKEWSVTPNQAHTLVVTTTNTNGS